MTVSSTANEEWPPAVTGLPRHNMDKSLLEYIRPMRAEEYFADLRQDLGEWPIFLSANTSKFLRRMSKGDATIFDMLREKIVELSLGYFTASNYIHISYVDTELPVFQARLTKDLRIIYQVGCYLDTKSQCFKQCINVFGVFTHTQKDRGHWEALVRPAHELDPRYLRRCLHRTVPYERTKGMYSTPPATFPLESPRDPTALKVHIPSGSNNMQWTANFAQQKFIPYSHALLENMRSNANGSYQFSVSAEEEEVIYHPSSSIVIGRSGTGKTTTMVYKMLALERAASRDSTKIRQLYITRSHVLAGRVEEYFRKVDASSKALLSGGASGGNLESLLNKDILDYLDEAEDTSNLPSKFSDLEDSHFPLFLTVDQLCKLLEADYEMYPGQRAGQTRRRDLLRMKHDDPLFLSYEKFISDIWPGLVRSRLSGLEPALVFSEFIGVIKGGEQSLEHPEGHLPRPNYESLSYKIAPVFSGCRSDIYDLFEVYTKRKATHGYYDHTDRIHALLQKMKAGVPGEPIHYLYVDEVQDNLLIEVEMLFRLCALPHGKFWAGDTAQTIAQGSSFRFKDLRASLYRKEVTHGKAKRTRNCIRSTPFELAINYRSHHGIVEAANSIVQLIYHFFPQSIDKLEPERGVLGGPKPVFFLCSSENTMGVEEFLVKGGNSSIEFGAEQAIIVRNKGARKALRDLIGANIGLILTVYESKGLEFNDILLYNFFSDSSASMEQWEVVLCGLKEHEKAGLGRLPVFSESYHAFLQQELKLLYVAITRAKGRVWIWDASPKAEPMRLFFSKMGLIELQDAKCDTPLFSGQSTQASWEETGKMLFAKQLYEQSVFCFQKAGLSLERNIASAFQSRQTALKIPKGAAKYRASWQETGKSFEKAAKASDTSPARAKRLFLLAGRSFAAASFYIDSARCFESGEDYVEATKCFHLAKDYEKAVQFVKRRRDFIDPLVAQLVIERAKIAFAQQGCYDKLEELFADTEEHLQFLGDWGLHEVKADVLGRIGRWSEGSQVLLELGKELDALRLCLRHKQTGPAKCILSEVLWKRFTLRASDAPTIEDENFADITQLLCTAPDLIRGELELELLAAMHQQRQTDTLSLSHRCAANKLMIPYLLYLDWKCHQPPQVATVPLDALVRSLETYDQYAKILKGLIKDPNVVSTPKLGQLLGFVGIANDSKGPPQEYLVYSCSILGPRANSDSAPNQTKKKPLRYHTVKLKEAIQTALKSRYDKVIGRLQDSIQKSCRALRPCTIFEVSGHCNGDEHHSSTRDHHRSPSTDPKQAFNLRVRAYSLLVILVDGMHYHTPSFGRKDRRVWLERFFNCLYGYSPASGVLPLLSSSHTKFRPALPILKTWLEERLFTLHPPDTVTSTKPPLREFLSGILTTSLLAFALDFGRAAKYTQRIRAPLRKVDYLQIKNPNQSSRSAVSDCFSWSSGRDENSLEHGVNFVSFITSSKDLKMDINPLITSMELLAAHLVAASRSSKTDRQSVVNFNGMTLPSSWILQLLAQPPPLPPKDKHRELLSRYLDACEMLLKSLSCPPPDLPEGKKTPENDYCLEGYPLHPTQHALRSVFSSRLCLALVLVGQHAPGTEIRTKINAIFGKIKKEPRRIKHWSVNRFFDAAGWSDLQKAVQASSDDRKFDNIVHLNREGVPVQFNRNFKLIRYRNEADLREKLGIKSCPITTNNPVVTALSTSPAPAPVGTSNAGEASQQTTKPNKEVNSQIQDLKVPSVKQGGTRLPDQEDICTAAAVTTLARRYRFIQRHKHSLPTGNMWFDLSKKRFEELPQLDEKKRYKKYFLGPLPHILQWLELILEECKKRRTKISSIILKGVANDSDWEELKEIDALLGRIKQLQKIIHPHSALHAKLCVDELLLAIQPIEELKRDFHEFLGKTTSGAPEEMNTSRQSDVIAEQYLLGYRGLSLPRSESASVKSPIVTCDSVSVQAR